MRKAQNRAAQRAYRDRKAKRLTNLEVAVAELSKAHDVDQREKKRLIVRKRYLEHELGKHKRAVSPDCPALACKSSTTGNDYDFEVEEITRDEENFDMRFFDEFLRIPELDDHDTPNGEHIEVEGSDIHPPRPKQLPSQKEYDDMETAYTQPSIEDSIRCGPLYHFLSQAAGSTCEKRYTSDSETPGDTPSIGDGQHKDQAPAGDNPEYWNFEYEEGSTSHMELDKSLVSSDMSPYLQGWNTGPPAQRDDLASLQWGVDITNAQGQEQDYGLPSFTSLGNSTCLWDASYDPSVQTLPTDLLPFKVDDDTKHAASRTTAAGDSITSYGNTRTMAGEKQNGEELTQSMATFSAAVQSATTSDLGEDNNSELPESESFVSVAKIW